MNEWAGIGNFNEFKERGQDSRIGRFLSVDPIVNKYPWNSPYAFAENRVIRGIDLEGAELLDVNTGWYSMQKYGGKNKVVALKMNNIPSVFKFDNIIPRFSPESVGMTTNGYVDYSKGTYLVPSNDLPKNPDWTLTTLQAEPTDGAAGGYIGSDVGSNRAFADKQNAKYTGVMVLYQNIKTATNDMPIWNAYTALHNNNRALDKAIKIAKNNFPLLNSSQTNDLTNFIYDGSLPDLNFQNLKGSLEKRKSIMDIGIPLMNKNRIEVKPETKEIQKTTTNILNTWGK